MIDVKEVFKHRDFIKKLIGTTTIVLIPSGGDPAMSGSTGSGGSSGGSSAGCGASFKLTDDGEGNLTLENVALVDNAGALFITYAISTSELNGHVTVGG